MLLQIYSLLAACRCTTHLPNKINNNNNYLAISLSLLLCSEIKTMERHVTDNLYGDIDVLMNDILLLFQYLATVQPINWSFLVKFFFFFDSLLVAFACYCECCKGIERAKINGQMSICCFFLSQLWTRIHLNVFLVGEPVVFDLWIAWSRFMNMNVCCIHANAKHKHN